MPDGDTKKAARMLQPGRMTPYEYKNQQWFVVAEAGTTIEEVKHPEYWASYAKDLKPFNRLHITADDEAWYCEAIVVKVGMNHAQIKVLTEVQLVEIAFEMEHVPATHDIKWMGPHRRFAVLRKSDGAILMEKLEKGEAHSWLAQHLRTIQNT